MSAIVEHWFVSCIVIATAGFWAAVVAYAWEDAIKRPPAWQERIIPDVIVLDEARGIKMDTTAMDREVMARTAYQVGRDGGWR